MSKTLLLLVSVLFCFSSADAQSLSSQKGPYPAVELPGSQIIKFKSSVNKQNYELLIALPGNYTDTSRRYPVLYALDGEWEFPLVTSLNGALIFDGFIPDIIIVGVGWPGNPEVERQRDFTAITVSGDSNTGGAPKFLSVLKTEVIPFIDSHYRSDKKNNILYGGSLGGYFAFYALFQDPSLFNRYIICSPALQWEDGLAFKAEKAFSEHSRSINAKILISSSETEESLFQETNFRKMISLLRSRKYEGLELDTLVVEKMSHASEGPYAIGRGLQFVFSKPDLILDSTQLDKFVGNYDQNWHITRTGNSLYINALGAKVKLHAETDTGFYAKGMKLLCEFKRDDNKKVTGCDLAFFSDERIYVKKIVNSKIAVELTTNQLTMLEGKYDFGKGIIVPVTMEGKRVFIKLPHTDKFEIFAENDTSFFSKTVDVTFEFKKEHGKVVGLISNEGIKYEGRKVE